MRASKRRSLVQIEAPVQVKDKYQAVTTSWQLFAEVWASIETLRAYEKVAVAASWPGASHKVTIRYIEGILPTMRINFNNQIYSILGINDVDMRHRDIELTCESGVKGQ